MLTRREFGRLAGCAAGWAGVGRGVGLGQDASSPANVRLEIAPYDLQVSAKKVIKTLAYNGQVPGAVVRLRAGREVSVEVKNLSPDPELAHWHGLFLPPEIDGAMEEGTPMIAPGTTARYRMTPAPAGFRWVHTHTFAGTNLRKAQYGGLHGFVMIDAADEPGRYDREVFLGLHDWEGLLSGGNDGSMNPVYEVSTINGKTLGYGEPVRVKQGERVLVHVLNSSPTEVHWVALAGHRFRVVALDGNAVGQQATVDMLRLAPAERVSAMVEMDKPGVWVLGEVRKHVQAAGMGIVFEYEGMGGKPVWVQPEELVWSYQQFGQGALETEPEVEKIHLAFDSKFEGHGGMEMWRINGKSYPHTEEPVLTAGKRYRLVMQNLSLDDHPMHLHRHVFDVRRVDRGAEMSGVVKDTVLVASKTTAEVEFTANNPGRTLFHCHQQDHMDRGFMMVFRYA